MDSEQELLQKKRIDTDAGQIFYFVDHSFSDRPWVVLLHGLSSNHTTWRNMTKEFRANHYNTLLLDIRGHGYSDKTRRPGLYRLERFTDDLKQVVEAEGLSSFVLVGYSFGGYIALDYALRYPSSLSGLLLISTNYVHPLVYKRLSFLAAVLSFFVSALGYLMVWQSRRQYHYYQYQKTELKGYWFSVYEGLKTMPVSVNLWLLSLMGRIDFRGQLKVLPFPTLVVRAEHDPFFGSREAEDMTRELGAKLITIIHPTHFLASHAQDKVAGVIFDFLDEVCA